MSQYADGTYRAMNPSWHDQDASWKADHVARLLDEHRIRPSSVCDMGCGTGGVLASLRGRFDAPTMVGWDISPDAVEIARSRHPEIEVRCEDLLQTTERYDVVLSLDVFEHVDDYLGFLRLLIRHGRYFVFHVPLDISVETVIRMRPILQARERIGHLHYFSQETALATLKTTGYLIEDAKYTREKGGASHLAKGRGHRLAKWPRRIGMRISSDLSVRILGGCSLLVLARPDNKKL